MSMRSLASTQSFSATIQSNQHHVLASRTFVSEIDALLSMEQQKPNALNHIRDVIVRLSREQTLLQQHCQRAVNVSEKASKAVASAPSTRTEENKMAFGVSGKPQERHRVSRFHPSIRLLSPQHIQFTPSLQSNLRCHTCKHVHTPEWRRGLDGPRTLCNACGLHYAKVSRQIHQSRKPATQCNAGNGLG